MNWTTLPKILSSWPFLLLLFLSFALPPWFIDTDKIFPKINPDDFLTAYFLACGIYLTLFWLKKIKQTTWIYLIRSFVLISLLVTTAFWMVAEETKNIINNTDILQLLILLTFPFSGYVIALLIRKVFPIKCNIQPMAPQSVWKGIIGLLFLFYGPILILDGYWNYSHNFDDIYVPFASPNTSEMLLGLFLLSLISFKNIKHLFVSIGRLLIKTYFWLRTDHNINFRFILELPKKTKQTPPSFRIEDYPPIPPLPSRASQLNQPIYLQDLITTMFAFIRNLNFEYAYPYTNYRKLFKFFTNIFPAIIASCILLISVNQSLMGIYNFWTQLLLLIISSVIYAKIIFNNKLNLYFEDCLKILKTYHDASDQEKGNSTLPKWEKYNLIMRKISKICIPISGFITFLFILTNNSLTRNINIIIICVLAIFIFGSIISSLMSWFISQLIYMLKAKKYYDSLIEVMLKSKSRTYSKMLN